MVAVVAMVGAAAGWAMVVVTAAKVDVDTHPPPRTRHILIRRKCFRCTMLRSASIARCPHEMNRTRAPCHTRRKPSSHTST